MNDTHDSDPVEAAARALAAELAHTVPTTLDGEDGGAPSQSESSPPPTPHELADEWTARRP
jgi:hypothetical protein